MHFETLETPIDSSQDDDFTATEMVYSGTRAHEMFLSAYGRSLTLTVEETHWRPVVSNVAQSS